MTYKNRSFSSGFFCFFSFKTIFLFIVCIISISCLFSQANTNAKDYLLSYPQTVVKAVETPFSWDNDNWTKASGFIFIGGVLYLFDEEISNMIKRNRNATTEDIAWFGNQFGEGIYIAPVLAATYLSGYVFDDKKTQETAMLAVKSFALANAASLSIKYLTQRERPFNDKGKQLWNGKGFNLKRDSFPSGHSTIVWSIAPILAEQYKETPWVAPTVYSIAALTSYARIHNQRHWASDVYAGALIGYFTAQLVQQPTDQISFEPTCFPAGIKIVWKF